MGVSVEPDLLVADFGSQAEFTCKIYAQDDRPTPSKSCQSSHTVWKLIQKVSFYNIASEASCILLKNHAENRRYNIAAKIVKMVKWDFLEDFKTLWLTTTGCPNKFGIGCKMI